MSRPLTRPPERSTAGGEREKNGSASSALGQSLHEAAIQPRLDGRFFFLNHGGAEHRRTGTEGGVRVGWVASNCSTRKHERTKGSDPGLRAGLPEPERARHLSCFRVFRAFVCACHAVRPRTRPPPRLRGSKPNVPHSHQSALPRYARRRSSCQMPRELIGSAPVKLSGSAMASDMLVALALALSA